MKKIRSNPLASMEMNILEHNIDRIRNLKRCTKCVLPETFPFIEYDGNGVCNYCLNYKKSEPKSIENLQNIVNNYKKDSDYFMLNASLSFFLIYIIKSPK